MEKTIEVDGKKVNLKANAMLPLIYRDTFGRDIFEAQGGIFGISVADGSVNVNAIKDLDCLGIMQVVYCMAKAADKTIPTFDSWLDGFESFPIFDVFAEVADLFMLNITATTKIKNGKAAEN